jgi:hypothetical protein
VNNQTRPLRFSLSIKHSSLDFQKGNGCYSPIIRGPAPAATVTSSGRKWPVLHTSREFSSRVSVSREYLCLERSRSSRKVSLHSICLLCPEGRPRIQSCCRERARAAVVLDSVFDGPRLCRRQLPKIRTHSRASGINRWYDTENPGYSGDLSTDDDGQESCPYLKSPKTHPMVRQRRWRKKKKLKYQNSKDVLMQRKHIFSRWKRLGLPRQEPATMKTCRGTVCKLRVRLR